MAVYDFRLRLISPAFIAGNDKNNPEMRAASIRGQLRYWLRAMVGASTDSLEEVWKRESAVFGSTNGSSAVSVRVYSDSPTKSSKYAMLPHRTDERERSFQVALKPGQVFNLQLVTRPGVFLPPDALNALALWSLLGGIGRRSRRMFGAVQVTASKSVNEWYTQPQTPDELATLITALLNQVASVPPCANIPDFPALNLSHSWVIVGKMPYTSYEDAVISLFRDLLRTDQFRGKQDTFGQALGGRRASPLIAQVRRIRMDGEDGYYPVLTALRSKPDNRIDWRHLKRFMEAAEKHFNAERVWGGW